MRAATLRFSAAARQATRSRAASSMTTSSPGSLPRASATLVQSHCRHCRTLTAAAGTVPRRAAPLSRFVSSTPAFRADEKPAADDAAAAAAADEDGAAAAGAEEAEATAEDAAEDELMALREQVEALTKDNSEQRDRTLRTLAEMENVRTIAQRDIKQARDFAIGKFAKGLLDVADNLERALEATGSLDEIDAEAQPQLHTLLQGVQMTEAQLHKAFGENKLVKFGAVGDEFDADLHEAMFEAPASDDAAPGSIAHVVKGGFKLNGRVIRWAQVGTVKK
jgi:molecular chaperone GrpE